MRCLLAETLTKEFVHSNILADYHQMGRNVGFLQHSALVPKEHGTVILPFLFLICNFSFACLCFFSQTCDAGIVFETNPDGSLPNHLTYKIRQNATMSQTTKLIRDLIWTPGPDPKGLIYYINGFSFMQVSFLKNRGFLLLLCAPLHSSVLDLRVQQSQCGLKGRCAGLSGFG